MKITKRAHYTALATLSVATLGFMSSAVAQTAIGTMAVTATVADSCLVTATPLAFGTLSTTAVTDEVAPAQISVICTSPKTDKTITLNAGNNVDSGQRRLLGAGSTYVPYNIFSDAAHTLPVAVDGAIYTGDLTAVTPNLIDVFGQIPAGAYAIGTYLDAVTVTLTY